VKKKAVLASLVAGLASLGAGLALWHPAAAATSPGGRGTFVARLPDIGTVYSRYDCTRGWRFGLGIRVTGPQTTVVRFRAGSFTRDRTLQPGDPTSWFRYSSSRVQWLAAGAGGENGAVVGWLRVVGYPSTGPNCAPYAPPRVTMQMYPRNYFLRGFTLRQFIG
jgi:hypothetical protein